MYALHAILIGALFGAGIYMMLRRSLVRLLFGLVLISHAVNLLIFTAGGLVRANEPLVPPGATAPPPGYADPIPQALVLTAIVIGFGLLAFTCVLVKQVVGAAGTDDVDELRGTDT